MGYTESDILTILDACCESYTFPMLDNGYVYLAATRMTLFRSDKEWAMAIEVLGYSPRSGHPGLHIYTFASRLANRPPAENYASMEGYENYLASNPHNESRFLEPIDEGDWIDEEELVSEDAVDVQIRGSVVPLPNITTYLEQGIQLEEAPRVSVFELCRALATSHRTELLATDSELKHHVLPEMVEVLRLEEWHHPDVVGDERPSTSMTFQQLAKVLVTGDASFFLSEIKSNTHWKNWPDGGTL